MVLNFTGQLLLGVVFVVTISSLPMTEVSVSSVVVDSVVFVVTISSLPMTEVSVSSVVVDSVIFS